MTVLLDANILVALFTNDDLTARATQVLETCSGTLLVSDFALAEFASTVSKKVRMRDLSKREAENVFQAIDLWSMTIAQKVRISSDDIDKASALMRMLKNGLRAPDAIHIATAFRFQATLATLDGRMAAEALRLNLPVLE